MIVHLLSNPASRSRRRVAANDAVRAAIEGRGHSIVELRPPSVAEIVPTITEARHGGVTRLVIVGGDGLLHQALPAIAGSDIVVGLVPVGTGNDVARALGLPTKLAAAVDAALGPATAIDLISATTGAWAASVVTGGYSGRVNARANRLRFPPGQQRYTVASLIELYGLRTVDVDLTLDDETHHLDTTLIAVANTRFFGGGMAICPEATPADGLLDVTVVGPTTRFELARVLPRVFSGRHVDHPSVTTYRARRVEVGTRAALWADGEPFVDGDQPTSTSFLAVPGALRVAGSLAGT